MSDFIVLTERKRFIEKQIQAIRDMVRDLPEGRLSCRKHGSGYNWYEVREKDSKAGGKAGNISVKDKTGRGHIFTYIPRQEREKLEKLAYKTYLLALERDLEVEHKAIESYQQISRKQGEVSRLLGDQGMAELLNPLLKQDENAGAVWAGEKYARSHEYPERLKVPTLAGINVRSKSEALIANLLYMKKIPFRYECRLTVGKTVLYPDFTIRQPGTGQILLWEHFGLLSDTEYQMEYWNKMRLYVVSGFMPYKTLITTYETGDRPFDVNDAEKMVRLFITDRAGVDVPVVRWEE